MRNPAVLPKKRTDCFLRRMPIYNKKRDALGRPAVLFRSAFSQSRAVSVRLCRTAKIFHALRASAHFTAGVGISEVADIISPLTRSICICTRGSPGRAGGKRARYPARPRLCTADSYILSLRGPHRAGEDGVFRPSRRSLCY